MANPTLLEQTDDRGAHRYLYWENGMASKHAQSVRMDPWWAYRDHPSKPIKLYDVTKDIDCKNDMTEKHPEMVKRGKAIFAKAHRYSDWYINPGESDVTIAAKRESAAAAITGD